MSRSNVRMDYALDLQGELARAEDAPKGEMYFCLDCGERVKLRRAEVRAPHFSHLDNTNCTGEGAVHHAAKLELARALRERQRPLKLEVPCCWPGCSQHVHSDLDARLGFITEVVTEYTFNTHDGQVFRFDVAALRHGKLQAAFEVYYHHRVGEEKRRFSNWFEVHAEPLLEDPYTLRMVRDSPPLNPEFEKVMLEYLAGEQPDVTGLDYYDFYRYRAPSSGLWFEERGWDITDPVAVPLDPDIDDFRFYACPDHLQAWYRLEKIIIQQGWPKESALPLESETESPRSLYEAALADLERTAAFMADFYGKQGVSSHMLEKLNLWGCRCPQCNKRIAIVQNTFVPEIGSFHGLLGVYNKTAVNYCAFCRGVVSRNVLSHQSGVSVPGALVAALMNEASV